MKMVDGRAAGGGFPRRPQAQTKFVLRKAMENGLKRSWSSTRIDRENAVPHKVSRHGV